MAEQYELVCYRYGSSLFHKLNDNAVLRPNVEELFRIIVPEIYNNKVPKKTLFYLCNNPDDGIVGSPIFATSKDCTEWRKIQRTNHITIPYYVRDFHNDEYCTGHR